MSYNLTLTIGGTDYQYSSTLVQPFTYSMDGMGADFGPTRNRCSLQLVYDPDLAAMLLATESNIKAVFTKDGTPVFTGVLKPLDALAINRTDKVIGLTIQDNNALLDVYNPALNVQNIHLCDPGTPGASLVHLLLGSIPGILDNAKLPTLTDNVANTMDKYVPLSSFITDGKSSIFQDFTKVLKENGYFHYFDAEGELRLGCYAKAVAAPEIELTDRDTIEGSVSARNGRQSSYDAEDSLRIRYRKKIVLQNKRVYDNNFAILKGGDWSNEYAKKWQGTTPGDATRQAAIRAMTYIDQSRALKSNMPLAFKQILSFSAYNTLYNEEKIVAYQTPRVYIATHVALDYSSSSFTDMDQTGNPVAITPIAQQIGTDGALTFSWDCPAMLEYSEFPPQKVYNQVTKQYLQIPGTSMTYTYSIARLCVDADVVISRYADTILEHIGPRQKFKEIVLDSCFSEASARTYLEFYRQVIFGGSNSLAFSSYSNLDVGKITHYYNTAGGLEFTGLIGKKSFDSATEIYTYEMVLTQGITRNTKADQPVETIPGVPTIVQENINPDTGQLLAPIDSTTLAPVPQIPNGSGLFLGGDRIGFYDATTGEWKSAIYVDGHCDLTGRIVAEQGFIGGMELAAGVLQDPAENLIIDTNTGKITAKDVDLSGKVTAESGAIGGWIVDRDNLKSADGNIILNGADGSISAVSQEFRIMGVTNFDTIKLDTLALDTDGDGDLVLSGGGMKAPVVYNTPVAQVGTVAIDVSSNAYRAFLDRSTGDAVVLAGEPSYHATKIYRKSTGAWQDRTPPSNLLVDCYYGYYEPFLLDNQVFLLFGSNTIRTSLKLVKWDLDTNEITTYTKAIGGNTGNLSLAMTGTGSGRRIRYIAGNNGMAEFNPFDPSTFETALFDYISMPETPINDVSINSLPSGKILFLYTSGGVARYTIYTIGGTFTAPKNAIGPGAIWPRHVSTKNGLIFNDDGIIGGGGPASNVDRYQSEYNESTDTWTLISQAPYRAAYPDFTYYVSSFLKVENAGGIESLYLIGLRLIGTDYATRREVFFLPGGSSTPKQVGMGVTERGVDIKGEYAILADGFMLRPATNDATNPYGVRRIVSSGAHRSASVITNQDDIITWGRTWAGTGIWNGMADDNLRFGWTVVPRPYRETKGSTIVKAFQNMGNIFVLWSSGNLYVGGRNDNGVCGQGNTTHYHQTMYVTGGVTEAFFPIGGSDGEYTTFRCFIRKTDGSYWGWGYNGYGALGLGNTTSPITTPTRIDSYFITNGLVISDLWNIGSTYGWTIVKTTTNRFFAVGYNGQGQSGLNHTNTLTTWTEITSLWLKDGYTEVLSIIAGSVYRSGNTVSASGNTAMLTRNPNNNTTRIYVAGSNEWGQHGKGNTTSALTPQLVNLTPTFTKIMTSGGAPGIYGALSTTGELYTWGYSDQMQNGVNTAKGIQIVTSGVRDFWLVGAGYSESYLSNLFVQKTNGELWGAGQNANYECGLGFNAGTSNKPLTLVESWDTTRTIIQMEKTDGEQGIKTVLALTEVGELYAWGYGGHGCCSLYGGEFSVSLPIRLEFPGKAGEYGPTPKVSIGDISLVETEAEASVSIAGPKDSPSISFKIPRGLPGVVLPDIDGLSTTDTMSPSDKLYLYQNGALKSINVSTITGAYLLPIGMITPFGGGTAPVGWLLCDGSAVSRVVYSALFTVLGTTWGIGDGTTTFNLPDMRGASPAGAGTSTGYTQNEQINLGQKYNDQIQDHLHDGQNFNTGQPGAFTWGGAGFNQNAPTSGPKANGANGTPRIGNVTRGKVVGVTYIIKSM